MVLCADRGHVTPQRAKESSVRGIEQMGRQERAEIEVIEVSRRQRVESREGGRRKEQRAEGSRGRGQGRRLIAG
jgi:hypothetical protein